MAVSRLRTTEPSASRNHAAVGFALQKQLCYYDKTLCWGYESQVTKTNFVKITQCVYWGMLTKCLPTHTCGLVYSTFKFVMLAIFVVE